MTLLVDELQVGLPGIDCEQRGERSYPDNDSQQGKPGSHISES
jgi:hypothetical protein